MPRFGSRYRPATAVNSWLVPPRPLGSLPGGLTTDVVAASTSVRSEVTAVASATPHTAGTVVEIDASLSQDVAGIYVRTVNTNSTTNDSSTLMEIMIGASLTTLWATAGCGYRSDNNNHFWIPGFIAAGTRVGVQIRSAVASQSITANYSFLPALGPVLVGDPVTLQANQATSRGLTITAPGALNTKGAWTSLGTAARAFSKIAVYPQGAGGTAMTGTGVLFDIGLDSVVAVPDVAIVGTTTEAYQIRSPLAYDLNIPAGASVDVRYQRANAATALDIVAVLA